MAKHHRYPLEWGSTSSVLESPQGVGWLDPLFPKPRFWDSQLPPCGMQSHRVGHQAEYIMLNIGGILILFFRMTNLTFLQISLWSIYLRSHYCPSVRKKPRKELDTLPNLIIYTMHHWAVLATVTFWFAPFFLHRGVSRQSLKITTIVPMVPHSCHTIQHNSRQHQTHNFTYQPPSLRSNTCRIAFVFT